MAHYRVTPANYHPRDGHNFGYSRKAAMKAAAVTIENIGSSGWTRTSNPPVNSTDGASSSPSLEPETWRELATGAMVATNQVRQAKADLNTGAFLPV